MIYRFEFPYGDRFQDLIERSDRYRVAILRALDQTGFVGHLCWPQRDALGLCLIAEGTNEVEALATAFIESTGAASGDVTTIGEAPDEVVGLSAEEQSAALIEMAIERERDRCERCNAVSFPPHRTWCPYGLDERGRGARRGANDADRGEGSLEVPPDGKVAEVT